MPYLPEMCRATAEHLGLIPRRREMAYIDSQHGTRQRSTFAIPQGIPPQLPVMIGVRASSVFGDYASRGSGTLYMPVGSFAQLLRFRGDVLEPGRAMLGGPGGWRSPQKHLADGDGRGGPAESFWLQHHLQQLLFGVHGVDHSDTGCLPTSHWCTQRTRRMLGSALRELISHGSSMKRGVAREQSGVADDEQLDPHVPDVLTDADDVVAAIGAAVSRVSGDRGSRGSPPSPAVVDPGTDDAKRLPDSATNELLSGVLCGAGEVLLTCGGSGRFVAPDASIGSRNHLNAVQ